MSESNNITLRPVRRTVANDNDCLFSCFVTLTGDDTIYQSGLRKICAVAAQNDPDKETRELLLGMSIDAYTVWIQNKFNWGGENEIIALSKHFNVEVAVVNCESLSVLVYGSEPNIKGRIYLLYTGQHYDPIVAVPEDQCDGDGGFEIKILDNMNADTLKTFEEHTLILAREENEAKKRRMNERRVKKLKCGGCGAIIDDNAGFQDHCASVEHDDDFAYECSEIEIVETIDDVIPEDRLDLTAESTFSFYNVATSPFANPFPSPISLYNTTFPTGEHCWQWAKFHVKDASFAQSLIDIPSFEDLRMTAATDGMNKVDDDWEEKKRGVLEAIVWAKVEQHPHIRGQLMNTFSKTIAFVDMDNWAGVHAPDGIPIGKNVLGQVWMQARAKLEPTQ